MRYETQWEFWPKIGNTQNTLMDKYIKVTLEKKRRKWNDKGDVGKT